MKNFLLLTLIFVSRVLAAQTGTFYVAARTGLSIRDKADPNGRVIEKIPFGTRITLIKEKQEQVPVKIEGMSGAWRKVNYNNKTGYIINSYLFSSPPPKATVKDMKGYLTQLSLPFGNKLVVKSGTMNNIEEGGWELHKQLYKNGAEWHNYQGYEYGSDTYFLPDINTQQAFLLIRMIPEFKDVFSENDVFPTENKTMKKGENEYTIKIEKEMIGDVPWIKKISIEYTNGASYDFELFQLENQVVIFYGSGV